MSLSLPRMPLGAWLEAAIEWLKDNLEWLFDAMKAVLAFLIDQLEFLLTLPPWWLLLLLIAGLAWWRAGKGLAVFSLIGLAVVQSLGLWDETMLTIALVLLSTALALMLGIPLGIWGARNAIVRNILRPLLDFMQTMPAFVYLIPAIMFFSLGRVPGAFATIIFAMPPAVRLTQLGILQVPEEVIEAARAFGSTPRQLLYKVQLPIAMPTILAGVNQTIMLALSMVVIAGMIGAPGLGEKVYSAVVSADVGNAFESGLAIVFIAIILDRLTHSFGNH